MATHYYTVTWDQLHRDARALAWRLMALRPLNGIVAVTALEALRKRPAAYPEVFFTSSRTGEGIPELRGHIMKTMAERGD